MSLPDLSKVHVPDAIKVNEIILDYLTDRSKQRVEDINRFIESSNRTDQLVIEVFKGLIAKNKV